MPKNAGDSILRGPSFLIAVLLGALVAPSLPAFAGEPDDQHFVIREHQAGGDLLLTEFEYLPGPLPTPPQKYDRDQHFGSWFDDPRDEECHNTRTVVLMRDSEARVRFTSSRRCTVRSGKWYDDYTDRYFAKASEIQIDHMVPLKNSYVSGAYAWSSRRRCLYANYLGFSEHLVPVSGVENQRKLDRTPADYLPPARGFRCTYLRNWLFIKLIWQLRLSSTEKRAIESEAEHHRCSEMDFTVSRVELMEQRNYIYDNIGYCDLRR